MITTAHEDFLTGEIPDKFVQVNLRSLLQQQSNSSQSSREGIRIVSLERRLFSQETLTQDILKDLGPLIQQDLRSRISWDLLETDLRSLNKSLLRQQHLATMNFAYTTLTLFVLLLFLVNHFFFEA